MKKLQKKKSGFSKKGFLFTMLAFATLFTFGLQDSVLAADPGKSAGTWVTTQVKGVFTGIVGAVSLVFVWKREFTKLTVFGIVVIIVGMFIYTPTTITSSGGGFVKSLLGIK